MSPRANLRVVTTARADPAPTGARTYLDPRIAAEIETAGKNVAAIGRGIAGQTTDTAIATAKTRLRAYAVEIAARAEAL